MTLTNIDINRFDVLIMNTNSRSRNCVSHFFFFKKNHYHSSTKMLFCIGQFLYIDYNIHVEFTWVVCESFSHHILNGCQK